MELQSTDLRIGNFVYDSYSDTIFEIVNIAFTYER